MNFEQAAAGAGIVDLDGRFVDVNTAYCDLLGRSREDIIGHHPDEFIVDRDRASAAEQIATALDGGRQDLGGEAAFDRPDGSRAWALVSVALVRGDRDEPAYFFVQAQDITRRKAAEETLSSTHAALRNALDGVVLAVARTLEMRDPYTAGHQERVEKHSVAIARSVGLDVDTVEGIAIAARIHDIGKIAVPSEILNRAGRLSHAEMEIVKVHAQAGHDIVAGIAFPWPVARMILEHHERVDGSGYPHGARGPELLLGSCIIAVADIVDAMASHRPYRPALGIDAALDVLAAGRGSQFHVDVIDAALPYFDSMRRPSNPDDGCTRVGDLVIDESARSATVAGSEIRLTRKEFDLLALLASTPGRAYAHDELLDLVWHSRRDWQCPKTVTEHIRRVRSKLASSSDRTPAIETLHGFGYALRRQPAAVQRA